MFSWPKSMIRIWKTSDAVDGQNPCHAPIGWCFIPVVALWHRIGNQAAHQPTDRPTDRPTTQPTNHPTNHPTTWKTCFESRDQTWPEISSTESLVKLAGVPSGTGFSCFKAAPMFQKELEFKPPNHQFSRVSGVAQLYLIDFTWRCPAFQAPPSLAKPRHA